MQNFGFLPSLTLVGISRVIAFGFGLIFTFIGINTFPGSVGFFIFINTILLICICEKDLSLSHIPFFAKYKFTK